jgi:LEA14-like dessication related protein
MKYFLILTITLLLFSCTRPEEIPVFRRVGDIRVNKISGNEAFLNGNAYFYNPNTVNLTLRKVAIDVILEDKKIGTINHNVRTKVPALSEFIVPVDATFNLGDVGVLQSILNVLQGRKMKARYKGYIKLSYRGIPVKVKVDYEDEIRMR